MTARARTMASMWLPPKWDYSPEKLRDLLKEKGWTQQRLADEIGITYEALKKHLTRKSMAHHMWICILLRLDAHPTHQMIERGPEREPETPAAQA